MILRLKQSESRNVLGSTRHEQTLKLHKSWHKSDSNLSTAQHDCTCSHRACSGRSDVFFSPVVLPRLLYRSRPRGDRTCTKQGQHKHKRRPHIDPSQQQPGRRSDLLDYSHLRVYVCNVVLFSRIFFEVEEPVLAVHLVHANFRAAVAIRVWFLRCFADTVILTVVVSV